VAFRLSTAADIGGGFIFHRRVLMTMRPRCPTVVLLLILAFLTSLAPVGARPEEKEFLHAFFHGHFKDPGEPFHPAFLKAVPASKMVEVHTLYVNALGSFTEALGSAGSYDLLFTRGKAPCKIQLDEQGLVTGFWLGPFEMFDDSLRVLRGEFQKLAGSGTVAVSIRRHGTEPVFDLNEGHPLAVGSTGKLYILQAWHNALDAGTLRREDVIPLQRERMTLPSGILQEWAPGTLITLDTLAQLMISLSDNTATDHLLHHVGRTAVESCAPARMRPFLAIREMFVLKHGPKEPREAYLAGDELVRRQILEHLATTTASLRDLSPVPKHNDTLEWHATTAELCALVHQLRTEPAMWINPGLTDKSRWHLVGYKGGSEAGVLNYTLVLQKAAASPTYCLSATINHPTTDVPTKPFTELVTRLISLIESERFGEPAP
jgi:hypothetical protein